MASSTLSRGSPGDTETQRIFKVHLHVTKQAEILHPPVFSQFVGISGRAVFLGSLTLKHDCPNLVSPVAWNLAFPWLCSAYYRKEQGPWEVGWTGEG